MAIVSSYIEDEEYDEKNMSCHFVQNDDDENIRHFGD